MNEYSVEEREDGYLLKYILVNKNGDELERWEAWIPDGDYAEKKRQASNVALLMSQCDRERIDALARLEAVRLALGGYKDSDLASLATTLKTRLDRATELLRSAEVFAGSCMSWKRGAAELESAIRAFLDERK